MGKKTKKSNKAKNKAQAKKATVSKTNSNLQTSSPKGSGIDIAALVSSLASSGTMTPELVQSLLKREHLANEFDAKKQFNKSMCKFQSAHSKLITSTIVEFTDRQTREDSRFVMPAHNEVKEHVVTNAPGYGFSFSATTKPVDDKIVVQSHDVTLEVSHVDGYSKYHTMRVSNSNLPVIDINTESAGSISKAIKTLLINAFGLVIESAERGVANAEDVTSRDGAAMSQGTSKEKTVEKMAGKGKQAGLKSVASVSIKKVTKGQITKITNNCSTAGVSVDTMLTQLKVQGHIDENIKVNQLPASLYQTALEAIVKCKLQMSPNVVYQKN